MSAGGCPEMKVFEQMVWLVAPVVMSSTRSVRVRKKLAAAIATINATITAQRIVAYPCRKPSLVMLYMSIAHIRILGLRKAKRAMAKKRQAIELQRRLPAQERARDTVEAIFEATARILQSHGRAGLNTNRVAELAGVSIGTLYSYFPNKEAI